MRVWAVIPYEVEGSIGILVNLCKAAKLKLYAGWWTSPIWISIPEDQEERKIVQELLIEVGFKPVETSEPITGYRQY